MNSRTRRIVAILAVVLSLPFSGMAAYGSVNSCSTVASPARLAVQGMHCCGERHLPCGTPTSTCPAANCTCASGCVQAQALVCPPSQSLTATSIRIGATSSVATLLTATSPDGQWRPPRFS